LRPFGEESRAMSIFETVNRFIWTINEEYIASEGECFEAEMFEDTIVYNPHDNARDEFTEDFIERYPIAESLEPFTMALLHEVGHLETEDEIIDDTDERNAIEDIHEYLNLFNERIATDWAGWYIEENFETVVQFNNTIKEILN
jgi:hypothetical protein